MHTHRAPRESVAGMRSGERSGERSAERSAERSVERSAERSAGSAEQATKEAPVTHLELAEREDELQDAAHEEVPGPGKGCVCQRCA